MERAGRALELGARSVVEHPTVGREGPVPAHVRGRRDAHHRRVQVQVPRGAEEAGGRPEVEDAPVAGHLEVAVAVRGRRDADDRLVERPATHGAEETGVAEVEDAPVGRDLPVAASVGCGRDADDRLIERLATHGAEESRVPEAEETAVGRDLPVALPIGCRGDSYDRSVERLPAHGAEETGVPEAEETAVGRDLPVALVPRGVGQAHDRLVERLAAHGAEEPDVVAEHAAVRGGHPVSLRARSLAVRACLEATGRVADDVPAGRAQGEGGRRGVDHGALCLEARRSPVACDGRIRQGAAALSEQSTAGGAIEGEPGAGVGHVAGHGHPEEVDSVRPEEARARCLEVDTTAGVAGTGRRVVDDGDTRGLPVPAAPDATAEVCRVAGDQRVREDDAVVVGQAAAALRRGVALDRRVVDVADVATECPASEALVAVRTIAAGGRVAGDRVGPQDQSLVILVQPAAAAVDCRVAREGRPGDGQRGVVVERPAQPSSGGGVAHGGVPDEARVGDAVEPVAVVDRATQGVVAARPDRGIAHETVVGEFHLFAGVDRTAIGRTRGVVHAVPREGGVVHCDGPVAVLQRTTLADRRVGVERVPVEPRRAEVVPDGAASVRRAVAGERGSGGPELPLVHHGPAAPGDGVVREDHGARGHCVVGVSDQHASTVTSRDRDVEQGKEGADVGRRGMPGGQHRSRGCGIGDGDAGPRAGDLDPGLVLGHDCAETGRLRQGVRTGGHVDRDGAGERVGLLDRGTERTLVRRVPHRPGSAQATRRGCHWPCSP